VPSGFTASISNKREVSTAGLFTRLIIAMLGISVNRRKLAASIQVSSADKQDARQSAKDQLA
jgi:hypothetical protein